MPSSPNLVDAPAVSGHVIEEVAAVVGAVARRGELLEPAGCHAFRRGLRTPGRRCALRAAGCDLKLSGGEHI